MVVDYMSYDCIFMLREKKVYYMQPTDSQSSTGNLMCGKTAGGQSGTATHACS